MPEHQHREEFLSNCPKCGQPVPASDQAREQRIEARLARLESYLGLSPLADKEPGAVSAESRTLEMTEAALEMRIGEFWLARVGILALLVGLVFLMAYPFPSLPAWVPCILGYAAVAVLFAASRWWKVSFPHLSRIVFGGGLFLFYVATLRLHFFSAQPLLTNKALGLALVVVVLAAAFVLAARQKSQFMAGLVVFLCMATCLMSDAPSFGFTLLVLTAGTVVLLLQRYNWQALTNVTIVLGYCVQLILLLNNPVLGHPLQSAAVGSGVFIYVFAQAIVFTAANCFHYQTADTVAARIARTIINGFGMFAVGNFIGVTSCRDHLAVLNLAISIFFLGSATLYWLHRRAKYSTSIYACFGYMALSAAIIARFPLPDVYLWLGWQSLLVAATAIWFCSKIIIVTNFFVYMSIYLAYLFLAPATGAVNLSYAVVALMSARLLKWQQGRLELQTELLRNLYLLTALIVVPYGLYHAVPKSWVSSSWLAAGLFYFLMSGLLRNKKYRWMAIITSFAAAVYAFAVDLAHLAPVYRVVLFLVLGVVFLMVSLLYARHRKQDKQPDVSSSPDRQ